MFQLIRHLLDDIRMYFEMFSGTISFQPEKQAYCDLLPFELPQNDKIIEIFARYTCNKSSRFHKLLSKRLGLFYSEEGGRITNHDWSDDDRVLLEDLYDSVLQRINAWERRPAQLHAISPKYFGKLYALKYEGGASEFGWHYDSLGPDEYRAIFTVKQSGRSRVSFAYLRNENEKDDNCYSNGKFRGESEM